MAEERREPMVASAAEGSGVVTVLCSDLVDPTDGHFRCCAPAARRVYTVVTMPTQMGIRQLRDSLTATIRRVRMGETIEVTHHGAPVAVLAPVPVDRIDRLVAGGEVTLGEPLTRPPRRFPVTGALSASQALEDDRAER